MVVIGGEGEMVCGLGALLERMPSKAQLGPIL